MFKMIIEKSVQFRWAVVFAATLVMAYGLFQLSRLPIDAVPDITNRQVQINTVAPALAPAQIERQVTYPLETALAGIPGLTSTRTSSVSPLPADLPLPHACARPLADARSKCRSGQ